MSFQTNTVLDLSGAVKIRDANALLNFAQGVLPDVDSALIEPLLQPTTPVFDTLPWIQLAESLEEGALKDGLAYLIQRVQFLNNRVAVFEKEFPSALQAWQKSTEESFQVETVFRRVLAQFYADKTKLEKLVLQTHDLLQRQETIIKKHYDSCRSKIVALETIGSSEKNKLSLLEPKLEEFTLEKRKCLLELEKYDFIELKNVFADIIKNRSLSSSITPVLSQDSLCTEVCSNLEQSPIKDKDLSPSLLRKNITFSILEQERKKIAKARVTIDNAIEKQKLQIEQLNRTIASTQNKNIQRSVRPPVPIQLGDKSFFNGVKKQTSSTNIDKFSDYGLSVNRVQRLPTSNQDIFRKRRY